MIGLLIKDFYTIKRQGKVLLALMMFYVLFSIFTKNVSMLAAIMIVMCVMMPVTTMGYDEQSKWDRYAVALPLSRKKMVTSKYLFGVILAGVAFVITFLLGLLVISFSHEMSVKELLIMTAAIDAVGVFLLALILPVIFKYGVERGRILMLLIIFLPSAAVMLLAQMGISLPSKETLELLMYFSPVLLILVYLASLKLSMQIFLKKEL
jgi:ABC-type transport system involved in multi-copper enzyme maturation permease subunit